MRLTRVVSLVAGITLLATGVAALLGRREDIAAERDRRLESTAALVAAHLDAAVGRITAALTVASPDSPIERLADAVAAPVCSVTAGATTCSPDAPDVSSDRLAPAVEAAAGRAAPVAVVDPEHEDRVAVAVDQGARALVGLATLDTTDVPAGISATLVPVAGEPLLRPRTAGGQRLYAAPSRAEIEDGRWAVRTSSAAAVHLAASERVLIGAQLAVGVVLALLALGAIVSEHRALQRRATTDALTRLPNRAEFERRAASELSRLARTGGSACLMVVDLDQFKIVNDTVGHEAGDRALVAVADRLRHAVRGTDLVGRWGGDEFVVLLPGVADARAVPERAATIANAIAAGPPVGPHDLTASVGPALFPAHGTTLDALLRAADRAMYAAKAQGVPHHLAEGRVAR